MGALLLAICREEREVPSDRGACTGRGRADRPPPPTLSPALSPPSSLFSS